MITLIRPDLGVPSGGTTYDLRLLREWSGSVVDVALPGSWPFPSDADRARFALALAGASGPVVVDGLVGATCPDEIEVAVARGVRVVLITHLPLDADVTLPHEVRMRLHDTEQRALNVASVVVVPSHHALRALESGFRVTRPVVVAEPGVDPAPLALGSEPPQLLILGALTPNKNHAVVLDALIRVPAGLPWRLVIAGPGETSTLDQRVALLNAGGVGSVGSQSSHGAAEGPRERSDRTPTGRVTFAGRDANETWSATDLEPTEQAPGTPTDRVTVTGAVTGRRLDDLWHATDLLLMPSLVETYGLVVTEALARGIPAFVSRDTGAAEALAGRPVDQDAPDEDGAEPDDLAGRLLDPRDPEAWASALVRWLSDPIERARFRTLAANRRTSLNPWSGTAAVMARAALG